MFLKLGNERLNVDNIIRYNVDEKIVNIQLETSRSVEYYDVVFEQSEHAESFASLIDSHVGGVVHPSSSVLDVLKTRAVVDYRMPPSRTPEELKKRADRRRTTSKGGKE